MSKNTTDTCVIIPMFGQEEYTKKCIELTKKNAGIPVDILVVDDGSLEPFDGVGFDSNYIDGVHIIRLRKNSGFTNATNQGLLWCLKKNSFESYKYVHLLNNDTEPMPYFIKLLHEVMEDDDSVAIASSARIHPDGGDGQVELYGADLLRGFQIVTTLEHLKNEIINCNWVPVCSSLIRLDVIRELGLLDKGMKNHCSDLDYCLRVKIAGYKIVIVTQSRVIHHHEITTREHKINPSGDQKILLEKLTGIHYAEFMKAMPLDAENKTYGKLDFTIYSK